MRDLEQSTRRRRADRRVATIAGHEGHLTEEHPWTERGHRELFTVLARAQGDGALAFLDDVELPSIRALSDDGFTRREQPLYRHRREQVEILVVEDAEKIHAT